MLRRFTTSRGIGSHRRTIANLHINHRSSVHFSLSAPPAPTSAVRLLRICTVTTDQAVTFSKCRRRAVSLKVLDRKRWLREI